MKRCDQLTFRPRWRLDVERLEDRNMLGDALSWLLGNFFWPDLLAVETERLNNLVTSSRAVVQSLSLVETWNRTDRDSLPGADDLRWVGRSERAKPPAGGMHRHSAQPEDVGDRWLDSLVVLPTPGRQPAVTDIPSNSSTGIVRTDDTVGRLPDDPERSDHEHEHDASHHAHQEMIPLALTADGSSKLHEHDHDHNAHHHAHSETIPLPSTAGIGSGLQSQRELAEIAFFTAEYGRYEESHPHGHEAELPGSDAPGHHNDEPTAGPGVPGDVGGGLSASVGQWGPTLSWPLVTVHSHMLPTGKVMLWAYSQDPRRIWDPATGQIEAAIPAAPGYNIFCVGHSFLADGRLFVAGGHVENGWGLPNASIYNPVADTWTRVPDMNAGRWYPTSTTLPNGDVLVSSGSMDVNYTNNTLPQVYQVATNTWRNLTTAQLTLPLYPFMFVAPDGRVFNAGPAQMSRYLDTSGTGTWTNVANNTFGYRDYGSAVMYEPGKVLLAGGGGGSDTGPPPSATAEVIDLNAATPAWRRVASMETGRRQHNVTVLPDGTVLATGGSNAPGFNNQAGAVHTAELWDPATETWTTLASSTQYRGYHSTALLLPDGRVLSSGGDNHANAEVFSPPYLFKGARPTVTAAPTGVAYGQSFSVETPDAAGIAKVTIVRLSSVTHAFNENQRFNSLSFTRVAGGLNVTAPANANLAPPGDYMMFLINGDGVPSVAKFVRVGTAGIPTAPSHVTAVAASPTQVDLTWQDNSANETGFQVERRTRKAGAYNVIATVGPNVTIYQDPGRSPDTQYFYRVRAINAAGASAYSNEVSAKPPSVVSARINFSNAGGEAFAGYVKDIGLAYSDRGNGFTYGWNVDNTAGARDRDAANSPDERYDSLNHLQQTSNPNAFWELAVPSGTYSVRLVSGDPSNFDSIYRLLVEGVLAINATPTSATRWFEGAVTVLVTDGRLTISNAPGASNNKINFIDVTAM
jgi:hypothetical protein